jgi:electron transport complex protein RnfE
VNPSPSEPQSLRTDVAMMLAMCPLLAASDTAVKAVGIAICVIIATVLSGAILQLLARWLDDTLRTAATLLTFAGIVALIERAVLAWFHPLHDALGVFLPLVAINAALIRAWHAPHAAPLETLRATSSMSLRIALVLLLLGLARELVGHGTLFDDAGLALGAAVAWLEMLVFRVDMGFLLAMLPPGAFIALGLLFAFYNWAFADRQPRSRDSV